MLIPLAEARERVDSIRLRRPEVVRVPVRTSLGRLAGEVVRATRALPGRELSAMDGFALRIGAGSPEGPFRLRRSTVSGGPRGRSRLRGTQAEYIVTGAPLPRGADAVVRLEMTRVESGQLHLRQPARRGQDIVRSGESVRPGDRVLERGRPIRPVDVGALLALGVRRVPVYRVRVSILPIGDELARPAPRSRPGVPEYIGPIVAGLLDSCEVELSPPLPDDRRTVTRALREAARTHDLVLTIGGSSIGEKDVTKSAIEDAGRLVFEGVRANVLKRGAVGLIDGVPVVVLPGQVVSAITVYHEHGLHVLSRLVGRELRTYEELPLAKDLDGHHRMDATYLVRCVAGKAEPLPWGVARITALLRADAVGTVSRGRRYRSGDVIRVQRLWSLG